MAVGAHELSLDFVEQLLSESNVQSETRTCKTCGETKPITDFYQYRPHQENRSWDCKVCFSAKVQARKNGTYTPRTEPFPREIEAAEGSKVCKTCDERKELDKFYYDSRYKNHVTECKKCISIKRSKVFAEKNKDKKESRSKGFELMSERGQRKLLQQRRYNAQRKLRRQGIRVKYDGVGLEDILKRDDQICYLCNEFVEIADLEFDHMIPLSRGGLDELWNISVTHRWCNRRKHNKLPEEYLGL